MSGSSYEYLCFKDLGDMLGDYQVMEQMERMQKRLAGLPYGKQAAEKTQRIMDRVAELDAALTEEIDAMKDVWHAVEWWDSGDWREDEVIKEVGKLAIQEDAKAAP